MNKDIFPFMGQGGSNIKGLKGLPFINPHEERRQLRAPVLTTLGLTEDHMQILDYLTTELVYLLNQIRKSKDFELNELANCYIKGVSQLQYGAFYIEDQYIRESCVLDKLSISMKEPAQKNRYELPIWGEVGKKDFVIVSIGLYLHNPNKTYYAT